MARRTFDVIDICEIFTHWHAGRSKNEIAGSLGLSRNTVRKYVAAAEAGGHGTGRPGGVPQHEWAELARSVVPGAGGHAAAAGDVAGDQASTGITSAGSWRPG